jgi:CRP-like cAMP-binding protein/GNAT superfamily N-acetyltransferase
VYAEDYPYKHFYDTRWLLRSVFTDDIVMLVAVDTETERVLGTASVVFDLGAHSDLLGEFGRLAVHPDARGRGVGGLLMRKRCEYVAPRLHVGLVQNRCVHPFSQRISKAHGFTALGFLPQKYLFRRRESIALWGMHFGSALALRRNHPRIIPEAHGLAALSMQGCGLPLDAIVDETAPPYPADGAFELESLTAQGLPALLRIERGRIRNREVFGPMRLTYGFFQLTARHADYLIVRQPGSGQVAGAIGYLHDETSHSAHAFELISQSEGVVHMLLRAFVDRCRDDLGVEYIEIDVSAHAPRMQRTLLELGFLPAAYVPAMVFHHVERLDVVKMVCLLSDLDVGDVQLVPETQAFADLVLGAFAHRMVLPRVAAAIGELDLFHGLSDEQAARVAGVCAVRSVVEGERLFAAGDPGESILVPLDADIQVLVDGAVVGTVSRGECLGEVAAITGDAHTASAVTAAAGDLAVLSRADLQELARLRPDIAVPLYRNLAIGLGRKLRRIDSSMAER